MKLLHHISHILSNHKVITDAIPDSIGGRLIGLVTSREEITDLLKVSKYE